MSKDIFDGLEGFFSEGYFYSSGVRFHIYEISEFFRSKGYLVYGEGGNYISKEDIEKFFVVKNEFDSLYGYNKQIKIRSSVFSALEGNIYISINYEKSKQGFLNVTEVFVKNNESLGTSLLFLNRLICTDLDRYSNVYMCSMGRFGHFESTRISLPFVELDESTMYGDSFKRVSEKIIKDLSEKNKGVFIFHGEPGTGKTKYIQYLTHTVKNKKFIFMPTMQASNLATPAFLQYLSENPGSVLVLEDCEDIIEDSLQGRSSSMSALLNSTDGILSDALGVQIICTFNTEIENVDEAIMRPGRLLCEYEFKRLSIEDSNRLIKHLRKDFEAKEEMSVAEIYNLDDLPQKSEVVEKKKIGFN